MCENPLSQEFKDALIADQARSLTMASRLGIDHIQAVLAAGARPTSSGPTRLGSRPFVSTITTLVLNEA